MRRPPIFLVWTLLVFSARPALAQHFTAREIKRYESETREVQLIRDKWGIPHIYGRTDAACVFGLMYAQCEEDFSRVEKNYLEMLGRQAEAYGEPWLQNDIMMRLIYDSAQAVADYQKCPVWMRKLLDAFADGINFYLYKHPSVQPLVLRRWEPWYALMFTDGSVSATSTGGIRPAAIWDFYTKNKELTVSPPRRVTHISDVEKMVLSDRGIAPPPAAPDPAPAASNPFPASSNPLPTTPVLPPAASDRGSNGFAIAPSRSASGNALLYINPHVPYYFRMEVQMVSEEGLNVYGAVTWGQFFVYQGFNEHCGWMHTSSYADVADLYAEKTSKKDGEWIYEYEGGPRPVHVKPFTLWYKKNDQLLSHTIRGLYTHHGPVIAAGKDAWLSLKEYNRSLNALLEAWLITKARTFDEYRQAMQLRANTTNNTVYADDKGNIAYWHGNFMPRRDTAYDWSLPVDGTIAATEWKGLHELEEIVHAYNPATGWIQNCNSTPYSLSGSGSPLRQGHPYYMAPDGENFRALNAIRLLSDAREMTLDSLITKGYDTYLTAFDRLLPALFEAYDAVRTTITGPDKQALQEAIDTLKQWNRRCAVHSIATTLAVEWGTRMAQYAPKPTLPEDGSHAVENLMAEIRNTTAEQRLQELTNTLAGLQQRFGSWKIEWGDACRYQRLTGRIQETYDDRLPSLPVGLVSSAFGALPSVVSRYMDNTQKRYAYSGNSFIAAVEFGKKIHARSIVTGGESSNPASSHFADQIDGYLNGHFKDVLFYKEDVLKNMEKSYRPGE